MPPVNFEAMIRDDANGMSRAQFLRRLSGNSSNTSATSKRASRKAVKVNSVGNSPHSIQRRRTTASHSTRTTHSLTHEHNHPSSGQQWGSSYAHKQAPSARPMSWHPGSRGLETSVEPFPASEPVMRNTIAGFENLTVTNLPPPSTEHSHPTSLPNPSYGMADYSTSYRPCVSTMAGYFYYEGAGTDCSAYSAYALPGQMDYPSIPLPYSDYGSYSSMDLQGTGWSQSSADLTSVPTPQTPDFLPIQYPTEPSQNFNLSPPISKKKSKELVGMGLYDYPDQASISSRDLLARFSEQRESMGKGLKLEETWQPPKDMEEEEEAEEEDGEEEEEEAYSTDEADEDVLPIVTPTSDAETQGAFYPTYGDLSNQTFFFDDDPYANCIAFQAIQECRQPKVPDAAYGSNERLYFNTL